MDKPLTEKQYFNSALPFQMVEHLVKFSDYSDRKFLLLASICNAHSIWTKNDGRIQSCKSRCVEFASLLEQFADGLISKEKYKVDHDVIWAGAAWACTTPINEWIVREIAWTESGEEYETHKEYILDIFGNPFHRIHQVGEHIPSRWTNMEYATKPRWLIWSDSRIPKTALQIYQNKSFVQVPFIADMLEEAGCEDASVINHCREKKPHVRGCWVLDLILDKK